MLPASLASDGLWFWTGVVLLYACQVDERAVGVSESEERPALEGTAGAAATAPGAAAGQAAAGSSSVSMMPAGVGDASCGEVRTAVPSPLDLLIQLDSSVSMLAPLPAGGLSNGVATKWDAVRAAFGDFLNAADAAEVGVGLSYFPRLREGVPASCNDNVECGAGSPCSNSLCVQSASYAGAVGQPAFTYVRAVGAGTQSCSGDAECGTGASCRVMSGVCIVPPSAGVTGGFLNLSEDPALTVSPLCNTQLDCEGLPGTICEPPGACDMQPAQSCTPTFPCAPAAGTCVASQYTCRNWVRCEIADYSTPEVTIELARLGAPRVLDSLAARTPAGRTPTGPALAGALAYAKVWARQHPERQLSTVLLTDGVPNDCSPTDVSGVVEIAKSGLNAAWPVRTFVIGVFGSGELDAADLDALAQAGGTARAWVADTAGDVARSLENALRAVQATAVTCGLALDAELARAPDRVQVELVFSDGNVRVLTPTGGPRGCADGAGWYYVRDVLDLPVRIELCPDFCLGAGSSTLARLRFGCAPGGDEKSQLEIGQRRD